MPSKLKAERDRQALESWKKDIKVVEGILKSMGADYDPAVVPQLFGLRVRTYHQCASTGTEVSNTCWAYSCRGSS